MTTLQYRRDGTPALISPIPFKAGMATTAEGAILATELLRICCRRRNEGQIVSTGHSVLSVHLNDEEMEQAIWDIRSLQQGVWHPWASLSRHRGGELIWSMEWPHVFKAIREHGANVPTPAIPGAVVSAIHAGASNPGAALATYAMVSRQCARLGWCAISVGEFAADAGMSVRKVRRALRDLSGDLDLLVKEDFQGYCSEFLIQGRWQG